LLISDFLLNQPLCIADAVFEYILFNARHGNAAFRLLPALSFRHPASALYPFLRSPLSGLVMLRTERTP
jgi:hypothetical protein